MNGERRFALIGAAAESGNDLNKAFGLGEWWLTGIFFKSMQEINA